MAGADDGLHGGGWWRMCGSLGEIDSIGSIAAREGLVSSAEMKTGGDG